MYTAIIVLIIILALILVFAILAQNSKGGVGSQFGGSGATQVMGVKRTGDFLERTTWVLGAAILVLTLSTSFILDNGDRQTGVSNVNADRAQGSGAVAPAQEIVPVDQNNTVDPADLLGTSDSTSGE